MTNRFPAVRQRIAAMTGLAAIALSFWANPSLAADPFRTNNPHKIGSKTEAAFRSIFEAGNYKDARRYLQEAEATESSEPLTYAMKASLAYMDQDWNSLKSYAIKTRQTAEKLVTSDPLRGNLYVAAGNFLEGAYILSPGGEGNVKGTPQALGKLQQVFTALKAAEKVDPQDPELNLLKGYMDLMLAVNLPFSNPNQAIDRLEKYANPRYIAYRGIAVGYRDLKQPNKAIQAINNALQAAPNNPDLLYLKAQILVRQGKNQESLRFFDQALAKQSQLPDRLVKQISWEKCRTQSRINNTEGSCQAVWNRS